MLIGVFCENITIPNRLAYIVDFINQHPSCPDEHQFSVNPKACDIRINYGSRRSKVGWSIPAQCIFFHENELPSTGFFANEYSFEALTLYSVEKEKKEIRPFLENQTFAFDVFECLFFHLSRMEEYSCPPSSKSRWDQMEPDCMFLVKNGIEKTPVVDQIIYAFFKSLNLIEKLPHTSIDISHDIDHIRKYSGTRSYLMKLFGHLKRLEISSLNKWRKQVKKHMDHDKDPFDVFEWMLISDQGRKHSRSIYFLMGGTSEYDTPIPVSDPIFLNALELAKEREYDIGIHPSYDSRENVSMVSKEKELLEGCLKSEIKISRQHYLRFNFPGTIRALEEAGIRQDASLGYYDRIGFRCGTGFRYSLYDMEAEKLSKLTEYPMIIMDSALLSECDPANVKNDMIRINNSFLESNKYFTHITYNFHNSRFDEAEMRSWPLKDVFDKAVERMNK